MYSLRGQVLVQVREGALADLAEAALRPLAGRRNGNDLLDRRHDRRDSGRVRSRRRRRLLGSSGESKHWALRHLFEGLRSEGH